MVRHNTRMELQFKPVGSPVIVDYWQGQWFIYRRRHIPCHGSYIFRNDWATGSQHGQLGAFCMRCSRDISKFKVQVIFVIGFLRILCGCKLGISIIELGKLVAALKLTNVQ